MTYILGDRGTYPISLRKQAPRGFPGVVGRRATCDAALALGEIERLPTEKAEHYRGLGAYRAHPISGKLREGQRSAVKWLAARSWGILALPTRTGKTITALAASLAAGARRVVVVAPTITLGVWAREIEQWLGVRPWILCGRGAGEIRRWRSELTGASEELLVAGRVPRHPPAERAAVGASGPATHEEIAEVLSGAPWTLLNYELLLEHRSRTAAGVDVAREDLPGWVPALRALTLPDLVIFDESHKIRSWKRGEDDGSIRLRAKELCDGVRQCWGLTATPTFGRRRHYWPMLDILSGGTFGARGTAFDFEARYCEGERRLTDYAPNGFWWADGASEDAEWTRRKEAFIYRRTRAQLGSDVPRVSHQVIRVPCEDFKWEKSDTGVGLARMLARSLYAKIDGIVESVMTELVAGEKVILYARLRESVATLNKALVKAWEAPRSEWRARLAQLGARRWATSGSDDARSRQTLCQEFSHHSGPGLFLSTIDAIPGGVRLAGATSVHFAEWHTEPPAMQQAAERPLEQGAAPLTILYYTAERTYDEACERVVLPKLRLLLSEGAAESAEVLAAVEAGRETTTREQIWALARTFENDVAPWEE